MKKVLVTITAMVLAVVMIGGCGAKAEAQKKDADSKKESSTMAMLEKPAEDRSLERSVSGLTKAVIEKQDERDAWLRSDSYDPDDYYDYARRVVVDADIAKYERLLETAKDNLAAKEAQTTLREAGEGFDEVHRAGDAAAAGKEKK